MKKPDWGDAPLWAKWLAQNDDGQWFWYEKKPTIAPNMGYFFAEGRDRYEEATYADDWDKTLEQRPKVKP